MNHDTSNTTVGMDEFHTPLKRLPERKFYGLAENQDREVPRTTLTSEATESLFATDDKDSFTSIPNEKPEALMPLNKISLKLSKTKLFNKQTDLFSRTAPKKSIYYKPPSSSNIDNQFGIQEFLPPVILKKYPVVSKTKNLTKNVSGSTEAELEFEPETQTPTGEWINPIMDVALSRQVNREAEIKSILTSIIGMLIVKLLERILVIKISGVSTYINVVVCIIALNISVRGFNLLKAKDQCLDLPLNNRQRELLGLNPLEDVFVAKPLQKPRYARVEA